MVTLLWKKVGGYSGWVGKILWANLKISGWLDWKL